MSNNFPLLGDHKISSDWWTPRAIFTKIEETFETTNFYDPCPAYGQQSAIAGKIPSGLDLSKWGNESGCVYINPPSPASIWADMAINYHQDTPDSSVIFAAYSEAVLYQCPRLKTYLTCWVRNRIAWDCPPPMLKSSPRNYNAFILLTNSPLIAHRFFDNFRDIGDIGYFQRFSPIL